MKKRLLGFVFGLALSVVMGQAQESLRVIAGLEQFEALNAQVEGATIHTEALVCSDKTVLMAVIRVLAEQANRLVEPQLSEILSRQVDNACWLDARVDLDFVALTEDREVLIFPLETAGFVQESQIRLVETTVMGLNLATVHSLNGLSVALKGTYTELEQPAYFAVLESVKIARP